MAEGEQPREAVYYSNRRIRALVLSQPSNGSFVLLVHSYDISTERRA